MPRDPQDLAPSRPSSSQDVAIPEADRAARRESLARKLWPWPVPSRWRSAKLVGYYHMYLHRYQAVLDIAEDTIQLHRYPVGASRVPERKDLPVPRSAALVLAAQLASDELELTWALERREARALWRGTAAITVTRTIHKDEPYQISMVLGASPRLVVASLNGVTLLEAQRVTPERHR